MQELSNLRSSILIPRRSRIDEGLSLVVGYWLFYMVIILKLLIVVAVVGLLRSLKWFRNMGRELDESAYASVKKLMRASEEYGYPPEAGPLFVVLMALLLTLMLPLTPFVR